MGRQAGKMIGRLFLVTQIMVSKTIVSVVFVMVWFVPRRHFVLPFNVSNLKPLSATWCAVKGDQSPNDLLINIIYLFTIKCNYKHFEYIKSWAG